MGNVLAKVRLIMALGMASAVSLAGCSDAEGDGATEMLSQMKVPPSSMPATGTPMEPVVDVTPSTDNTTAMVTDLDPLGPPETQEPVTDAMDNMEPDTVAPEPVLDPLDETDPMDGDPMDGDPMDGDPMDGDPMEMAGDGAPDPVVDGDCLCRGDDPTEASTLERRGPFNIETFTSGFDRASGATSSTVHYPTDAEPPFAGVAVVPGFVSPESSIREWGPFLASHGIVTVTIGVPGSDQPRTRATKLLGTIEGIKGENTRSGSPLEGKIDVNRMAVSGWSMGGGGTLIAVSGNPELKAGVSFAAWGPSGGSRNTVPVLMFEATADALAAAMSDGFHRQVPDTVPKMLFEVRGSSHNVANSPHRHDGLIGKYGLSWFKMFLEGDDRYRQFINGEFPSITTAKSSHNLD